MGWPRRDAWLVVLGTIEVLGLALWIGGLLVIMVAVIPAVFNIGMEAGGRLLTRIFEGYNQAVGAVIGILVATALLRRRLGAPGSRGRAGLIEGGVLVLMIALYAAIVLWLGPQAAAQQAQAFAAEGEAAKRAAYEAFFRTHAVVRALYIVNLGVGVALLAVKVKSWMIR